MVEINNRTKARINALLIRKTAEKFLKEKRKADYELSIAIVSDSEIKKLNRQYRKINRPTDVLSFPGEGKFLGEIVLGLAQIKRQARELKKTAEDELIFILIHGLLHLIGLDDKTEKGRVRMIKEGEEFLRKNKPV
ncbi:MAG: rRNA maturation RNase YbeY [Patescibacteria group bacterium]|jgi:probable rRNA maturation factor